MATLQNIRNKSGLLLAVIGIAMLTKPHWEVFQTIKIQINQETYKGKVCELPFI